MLNYINNGRKVFHMDSNDNPSKKAGLSFYAVLLVFSLISLFLPSMGMAILLISGYSIFQNVFWVILIISVIWQLISLKFLKDRGLLKKAAIFLLFSSLVLGPFLFASSIQLIAYNNRLYEHYNFGVPESQEISDVYKVSVSSGYLFMYSLQNLTAIGLFTALATSGMKKSRRTLALLVVIPILSIASNYGCLIVLDNLNKCFSGF
jgi:hypothetical protein